MREIKFRAWDSVQQKMWFDMLIDFNGNVLDANENRNYRMTLMQYTGLKDKNNKEIYEGDIVKFVEDTLNEIYKASPVIYDEDRFTFLGRYSNDCIMHDWHEIEVIGNIYENPELTTRNNEKEGTNRV